ncbi:MAG TPA: hypothetical protein VFC07_04070 [Verrucomicrobiae bacterium]|nr:hypothetical protein [Verrucomicrobiae bacterium]
MKYLICLAGVVALFAFTGCESDHGYSQSQQNYGHQNNFGRQTWGPEDYGRGGFGPEYNEGYGAGGSYVGPPTYPAYPYSNQYGGPRREFP